MTWAREPDTCPIANAAISSPARSATREIAPGRRTKSRICPRVNEIPCSKQDWSSW
jgi:hypothetical protein